MDGLHDGVQFHACRYSGEEEAMHCTAIVLKNETNQKIGRSACTSVGISLRSRV